MKKFNLKKSAASKDFGSYDKMLEDRAEEQNLSGTDISHKNINISLPTENKDNIVPFNQQLNAARKNETRFITLEAKMDDDFTRRNKEIHIGDNTKQIMDINIRTQEHMDKKEEAFKLAEEKSKSDTAFWDKYVGVQLEGTMKDVNKNIPSSTSQLPNNPERFKEKEIDKMVMASLKDADAMLFHIHATAAKENRKLKEAEQQQIIDINSGKMRLLATMVDPVRRSLEYIADPVIKQKGDKVVVIEHDGTPVDEFKSCEEAKANYPEGEIESA